jgi:type VI secretion system protein ImpK
MTKRDRDGAGGAMGAGGEANDLASVQFRLFVAELTNVVTAGIALGEAQGRAGAERFSAQLCQLIELQTLEAGRHGGKAGGEADRQGRFLKAALADEVLLHTDWAGKAHWRHVLIEATLFSSGHAGQRVFDDIDQLLREREPVRRGVARLYLYLLALGFQGRYRDGSGLAQIADYRRELFQFIYQRAPDLRARDAVLSEQPYASTLAYGGARRLSKLSRGKVTLALALLILLGVSEILWLWQSWAVRDALNAPVARAAIAALTVAAAGVAPC